MTTVTDVIEAIRAETGSSWAIADALADLPEVDETGQKLTLDRIADDIYKQTGDEWNPSALGAYRMTALAFPIRSRDRLPTQTFSVAKVLRACPDKLINWKPTKPGDILTVERAKALRGRSGAGKQDADQWRGQLKKAFGVIDRLSEHDPAFVIDLLEQSVVNLRRRHAKQLSKEAARGLRAV